MEINNKPKEEETTKGRIRWLLGGKTMISLDEEDDKKGVDAYSKAQLIEGKRW